MEDNAVFILAAAGVIGLLIYWLQALGTPKN